MRHVSCGFYSLGPKCRYPRLGMSFPLAFSTASCQYVDMVCVYCSATTNVTNSREQRRLGQTWRRRQCQQCQAVFTTLEAADLASSFRVIIRDRSFVPFSRDHLYVSIYQSLGHRSDALEAATALSSTVISSVLKTAQEGRIERKAIIEAVQAVLTRFDKAAAVQYVAYHPL